MNLVHMMNGTSNLEAYQSSVSLIKMQWGKKFTACKQAVGVTKSISIDLYLEMWDLINSHNSLLYHNNGPNFT
jgi:hypothetical protein